MRAFLKTKPRRMTGYAEILLAIKPSLAAKHCLLAAHAKQLPEQP
jgi:hypothetical protein